MWIALAFFLCSGRLAGGGWIRCVWAGSGGGLREDVVQKIGCGKCLLVEDMWRVLLETSENDGAELV